jgi:hypothetical protein
MPPPPDNSDKRLLRAAKHVTSHWFPINPEVLSAIKNGFNDGSLTEDIEGVLTLLKKDFALFTFVTKELLPIAEKRGAPATLRANPLELIRWVGVPAIKEIIFNDSALPNTHHLESSSDFQNARIRETTIIASTAEVLSENKQLNPEMGFCRGVVREIGLNLIAWNYPTLYARVLKSLTARTTLDELLTQELGFSPITLAMHLLKPAAKNGNKFEEEKIHETWAVYDDLCVIGEALSRASNPNTYPTAENDWQKAAEFIHKSIGENGIELIRNRAMKHAEEYISAVPIAFSPIKDINPEREINSHLRGSRALENHYLKQCPQHVQAALRTLYSEMPRSHVNRDALEILLKEVIPAAGFTGGCIFVVDPASLALAPRTVIGKVTLRPVQRVALKTIPGNGSNALISETILSSAGTSSDLAAAAFACSYPLMERSEESADSGTIGMYASLGTKRRVGVLYLEAPENNVGDTNGGAVLLFKALRQTLCDALLVE